jgi:hypothetical protein
MLASACQFNVSRNGDGTLTVDTSISQQELQDEISAAIADPLIKEITVSLQSGYILVTGERQRLNDASKTDALSFRLDLGASNGQLTSTISEAQLDGKPIEQNRVDNWNQTIANRIQNFGQKRSNATLQTVSVTPSGVSMTWLVTRK